MRDVCAIIFILIFAGLAFVQALTRGAGESDAARVAVLARQSLAEAKSSSGDWPLWRGPARDGIALDDISANWPDGGPAKLWEQRTGEGYSAVVVANGLVFAFFQVEGDETLVAFDRLTGQERWRFGYPAFYQNNYGNGPRSSPTVDGDRVYTVGATGLLHCIDTKSGQKLWAKDLLTEFNAPTPKWGIAFSPLIDGDKLILCPGGKTGSVVALDKRSGDILWKSLSDGGGYSSPLVAELAGESQLIAFTAEGLVGLERGTGKLLWRYPWTTSWDCNIATPIVAGDYVFITSGYDRGCALVHVKKNEQGWAAERVYENTKLRSHFASCVRFGDTIYGFDESTLVALNLRDGKTQWRQRGFGKGSILGVGGRLLVLGDTGTCALAEASADKYREISRFTFSDQRCWTVPVVAHGLLFIRDQTTLACFDVRK